MKKIIVKDLWYGNTWEYDSLEEARDSIDDMYINCSDSEDYAENILYALLCDLNEAVDGNLDYCEEDENGNLIFERSY